MTLGEIGLLQRAIRLLHSNAEESRLIAKSCHAELRDDYNYEADAYEYAIELLEAL